MIAHCTGCIVLLPLTSMDEQLQSEEAVVPRKRTLYYKLAAVAVFIAGCASFLGNGANPFSARPRVHTQTPPVVADVTGFQPAGLLWEKAQTPVPWETRDSQTIYVWQDKLYMLAGLDANMAKVSPTAVVYEKAKYFNDIWVTENGEQWNLITEHAAFPPIRSASIVEFQGALWMLGGWSPDPKVGYDNGIWKSTDGEHWTQVVKKTDFVPREGFRTVEHKGRICFFGGVNYFAKKTYNDVWCSNDAVHWTEVTKDAGWAGRWDYDAVSYHGNFYVVGGMTLGKPLSGWNDVWMSTDDGVTWTKLLEHAPWTERQGHVLLVWKDLIWLIGGLHPDKNTGVGDTWFTSDGTNWTKTTIDGNWRGREDHGTVVWRDALWLVAGMDDQWMWTNDFWHTATTTN